MTTSTIGQRVKKAREKLDLSQRKLARIMGISRQYLSMIELDKYKSLRSSLLVEMSTILKTSVEYLAEGREFTGTYSIDVPVITWIDIGEKMEDINNNNAQTMPLVGVGGKNSFVLINETISMYSDSPLHSESFFKGDILYFDAEKKPEEGDYVVAKKKGENEAIFRKLIKEDNKLYLVALNIQFKAILASSYKIYGVLIARLNLFDKKNNPSS